MPTKRKPPVDVRVGDVWKDKDTRFGDRWVRVLEIADGKALCQPVDKFKTAIHDGRATKLSVERMGRGQGWALESRA